MYEEHERNSLGEVGVGASMLDPRNLPMDPITRSLLKLDPISNAIFKGIFGKARPLPPIGRKRTFHSIGRGKVVQQVVDSPWHPGTRIWWEIEANGVRKPLPDEQQEDEGMDGPFISGDEPVVTMGDDGMPENLGVVADMARALQNRRKRNLARLQIQAPMMGLGLDESDMNGRMDTDDLEGYDGLDELADDLAALDAVDLDTMHDEQVVAMVSGIDPELTDDMEALGSGDLEGLGRRRKRKKAKGGGRSRGFAVRGCPSSRRRSMIVAAPVNKGPDDMMPGPQADADAATDNPEPPSDITPEIPDGARVIDTPDGMITESGDEVNPDDVLNGPYVNASGASMNGPYVPTGDGLGKFNFGKLFKNITPLVGMIPGASFLTPVLDAAGKAMDKKTKVQTAQLPGVGQVLLDGNGMAIATMGPDGKWIATPKPVAPAQLQKDAKGNKTLMTGLAIGGGVLVLGLIGVVALKK